VLGYGIGTHALTGWGRGCSGAEEKEDEEVEEEKEEERGRETRCRVKAIPQSQYSIAAPLLGGGIPVPTPVEARGS
jgi:hypothetical protein